MHSSWLSLPHHNAVSVLVSAKAYYKIGVLYQKQAREDEKQQEGDKKTHDLSDKLKVFSYQVL